MVGADAYDRMVPLVAPEYHQGKVCYIDQQLTAYRTILSLKVVSGYYTGNVH